MKKPVTKANTLKATLGVAHQRLVRTCVTHHYACDCREDAMRVLLKEVMWWHSDPTLAEYNGCDKEPCMWCENAKRMLGEVGSGEQVANEIAGPNADLSGAK